MPEIPSIGTSFVIALVGGDDATVDDRVMECIVVGNDFWDHISSMTDPTLWVHL